MFYGWCVLTIVYAQINLTECKRKTRDRKLYNCFYISFAAFMIDTKHEIRIMEDIPFNSLISLIYIFRSYLFNGTSDIITPFLSLSLSKCNLWLDEYSRDAMMNMSLPRAKTLFYRIQYFNSGNIRTWCRWNWDLSDLRIFQHCVTALRIFGFFNIASNLDHALFYISHGKRAILICSGIFIIAYFNLYSNFYNKIVPINLDTQFFILLFSRASEFSLSTLLTLD